MKKKNQKALRAACSEAERREREYREWAGFNGWGWDCPTSTEAGPEKP